MRSHPGSSFSEGSQTMYSRVITCDIQPAHIHEFRTIVNEELLPRIEQQPGFLENIESVDPATGKYCCMTLWENEAAIRNYDNGLFREIATKLGPMMQGAPTVQTLPVDNASAQHVRAGKLVAA